MQETLLATPTIRLTKAADAILRRVLELPTNAHVAHHLGLDPGHFSRVKNQQHEVSSQVVARLVLALLQADVQATDLIEVLDADGSVLRLGVTWNGPALPVNSIERERLAS